VCHKNCILYWSLCQVCCDCSAMDDQSVTNYSLALTGATWSVVRTHFPELIPRIATRGAVFSRMSPDQKQQLIQTLQSLGYYVGE
jgi:magnesium-transporting ATPase (P-type)